jgi:hypothetical protein
LLKSRKKKKKKQTNLTFETTKLKNKTGLGRQVSTFELAGWVIEIGSFFKLSYRPDLSFKFSYPAWSWWY